MSFIEPSAKFGALQRQQFIANGNQNTVFGFRAAQRQLVNEIVGDTAMSDEDDYLKLYRKPQSMDCKTLADRLESINRLTTVINLGQPQWTEQQLKRIYFNMMPETFRYSFTMNGDRGLSDPNYTLTTLAEVMQSKWSLVRIRVNLERRRQNRQPRVARRYNGNRGSYRNWSNHGRYGSNNNYRSNNNRDSRSNGQFNRFSNGRGPNNGNGGSSGNNYNNQGGQSGFNRNNGRGSNGNGNRSFNSGRNFNSNRGNGSNGGNNQQQRGQDNFQVDDERNQDVDFDDDDQDFDPQQEHDDEFQDDHQFEGEHQEEEEDHFLTDFGQLGLDGSY